MTRLRPRNALLVLGFGLGLVLAVGGSACVLPNLDHCVHLAIDPHAWCFARYGEDMPYCSPCASENNGCVSDHPAPNVCSTYSPPANTDTDTGETGTSETGTSETDTGETGF